MTREEILSIAYSIGTVGEPWWLDDDDLRDFVRAIAPRLEAAARADERERAAHAAGEYARKWWVRHSATNKHMTTTREAHDDFCALQSAIRARKDNT